MPEKDQKAPAKLDNPNFERAFAGHVAGPVGECDCNRVFWDCYNEGYSWEDGERERLEADPAATRLDYAVSYVEFEGHRYVHDCACWHPRAARLAAFLDAHAGEIAEYLTLEKRRRTSEAERSPVVGD